MMSKPMKKDKIVVLHSLAEPDGPTKYAVQMRDGSASFVETQFFSWPRALFGRYDVFHVHWPEYLVRHRKPLYRLAQRGFYCLFIMRLVIFNVPVVRTLHNLHPHEGTGRLERYLMSLMDWRTDVLIRLNPTTEVSSSKPVQTIPHGHYVDRFSQFPRPAAVAGRLLYFGLIRPYKGVEELLDVFSAESGGDLDLRIVGKPLSTDLRNHIEQRTSINPRITTDLRFVDDEQLVREFSLAELVVLPYREMHNSGVLLVAISLGRPVLVPATSSNRWLADEVGTNWIICYEGEISMDLISAAMKKARETLQSGETPDLSGRSWTEVGRRHADVYQAALLKRQGASRWQ